MIGLAIAARCFAFLYGERIRKDAHKKGFEYAKRLLDANQDGPALRSTVDALMTEAYQAEKEDGVMVKQYAAGIYEALADYRDDYSASRLYKKK